VRFQRIGGVWTVTKTYLLEDQRSHSLVGPQDDFLELCELPLGNEPLSYLVMANGYVERTFLQQLEGALPITIRLDVLSKFSVLLARDENTFDLQAVTNVASPTGLYFNQVVSRHFTLMVVATVPAKGGGGGSITGEPFVIPPPRAILSAQLRTTVQALASLQDVRIVAFPADEIDVKTLT
jgi:hypothetical protein